MKQKTILYTIFSLMVLTILPANPLGAVTLGQSFTPTSAILPISSIGLIGSDGTNHELYNCTARTVAGCSLDLLNQAALTAAFSTGATASIPVDTYSQIYINTCPGGGSGYTLKVKGTVTLGGTAYVTSPGTGTGTNMLILPGVADYASFSVSGCQTNYAIPLGGLQVTDGSDLTVNLLVDVNNLVHALDGPVTYMGSACSTGTTNSLCYSYPVMIPYVGSATVIKETYRLTSPGDVSLTGNQGFAELVFFLEPVSGTLLGISTRNVFDTLTYIGTNVTTPVAQPTGLVCSSLTCAWKITPFISAFRTFGGTGLGPYNLVGWGDNGVITPELILIPSFMRIATVGGTATTGTMTSPAAVFSQTMTDATIVAGYKAIRTN